MDKKTHQGESKEVESKHKSHQGDGSSRKNKSNSSSHEQKQKNENAEVEKASENSDLMEINSIPNEDGHDQEQKTKKKVHRKHTKSKREKSKDPVAPNYDKEEKVEESSQKQKNPEKDKESPLKSETKSPQKQEQDKSSKHGRKSKRNVHIPQEDHPPNLPHVPNKIIDPDDVVPVKKTSLMRFSDPMSFSSEEVFKSTESIETADWGRFSTDSLSGEGTYDSAHRRRANITKPVLEKNSHVTAHKHISQKVQPPKEAPPARKSRDLSGTFSFDTDTIKAELMRTNDSSVFTTDDSTASLHEPMPSNQKRARKSPLRGYSRSRLSNDLTPIDEIAIVTESDSSEEEENRKSAQFTGPFFSESASSSDLKKKADKKRPPKLTINNKPCSREARRINHELEIRNQGKLHEPFVLNMDTSCLNGKKYTPPNWDIEVRELNEANDAKYIHQMQTMYSMSSVLNGLKKQ